MENGSFVIAPINKFTLEGVAQTAKDLAEVAKNLYEIRFTRSGNSSLYTAKAFGCSPSHRPRAIIEENSELVSVTGTQNLQQVIDETLWKPFPKTIRIINRDLYLSPVLWTIFYERPSSYVKGAAKEEQKLIENAEFS